MAQSDMKQPSSNRTIVAAVAGFVAGILAYGWWHWHVLTAILVAAAVFILLWWLLGMLWADDAPTTSAAAPTPEPVRTPAPIPAPVAAAPAAPMAEAAAPASVSGPAAMFTAEPAAAAAPAPKPKTAAKAPAKAAAVKAPAKPAVAKAPKVKKPDGPVRLSAPRKGKADDLKEIEGIGPALEKLCNELGFYHFDQIAGWSDADVAWVDANMKTFKGRVVRDKWIAQSKIIITEGLEAFRLRAKTNDY